MATPITNKQLAEGLNNILVKFVKNAIPDKPNQKKKFNHAQRKLVEEILNAFSEELFYGRSPF